MTRFPQTNTLWQGTTTTKFPFNGVVLVPNDITIGYKQTKTYSVFIQTNFRKDYTLTLRLLFYISRKLNGIKDHSELHVLESRLTVRSWTKKDGQLGHDRRWEAYLSMRFISWRPSPLRKRSRLELSIRQEQRESNRFSIISCSSAVLGLCLLNTCQAKITEGTES